MIDKPPFTIVLPCFNEGSRIAESLATLERWFGSAPEILILDDGSADETAQRAEEFSRTHSNVRVHRLLTGGQGDPDRVHAGARRPRAADRRRPCLRSRFDRSRAQRAGVGGHGGGNRRHDRSRYSVPVNLFGFLYRRHIVGLAFNAFVRALLQLGLRDTQCGLKDFRRETLDRMAGSLSADGFTIDVEMLLVARALGLRLAEVPVHVTYYSAKSSVKLVRSGVSMASEVIGIAMRRALGAYSLARVRASAARSQPKPPVQSEKESVR